MDQRVTPLGASAILDRDPFTRPWSFSLRKRRNFQVTTTLSRPNSHNHSNIREMLTHSRVFEQFSEIASKWTPLPNRPPYQFTA